MAKIYQELTYDCQNTKHKNGLDLPDELFPSQEQTKNLNLDPEICLKCQGVLI